MMNKAKSKKLTLGMPPFDVPKVTKMLVWRGDDLAALSSIPLNSVFFTMGSSIKDVRKFLSVFNPPPSPCLHLSALCLINVNNPLSLSVRTLSWKTRKELQKLWKNKYSFEKDMHNVLISCFLVFLSLTQEDNIYKITFKCPLLSSRDHTEKDVH